MKAKSINIFVLAIATCTLAACGGGSDGDSGGICSTAQQSLVSSSANTGSTLSNADLALDGNLGTYASIAPLVTGGGATIRGVGAQHGAGQAAGVAFTTPSAGSFTITITTFLGNVQQESSQAGTNTYGAAPSQTCSGTCLNSSASNQSFFGINTTKPFDSIQAAVSVTGSGSTVQVLELCTK